MASITPPAGLRVFLSVTRLGQKSADNLVLADMFYRHAWSQVVASVHVAVSVRDRDESVDLLWSLTLSKAFELK